MKILVSEAQAAEAQDLQSIAPWLHQKNPVWEGEPPLGVFLNDADLAIYQASDFSAVMTLLNIPVASGQTLEDFRAAAMAARLNQALAEAAKERAAAAALRIDFMQLQENFCAVEEFLNGALAPKFTLARQWDFADKSMELTAGQSLNQPLPVSSAALVAVDLWMVSGKALVRLCSPDGAQYTDPKEITGTGWQRVQFPAIAGQPNDVALQVDAIEPCEIGLTHPAPLPDFGETPLALRLWKGLAGVRLPEISIEGTAKKRSYVMPSDLPNAESLGAGSTKYLETENILMIHTDYYGAAHLALRNVKLAPNTTAHIQNCGPETLEVLVCQVQSGLKEPAKYIPSVFLAPEAYMQADVLTDGTDAVDIIVKIEGQTSLDCLSIRGFEIG